MYVMYILLKSSVILPVRTLLLDVPVSSQWYIGEPLVPEPCRHGAKCT